MYSDESELIPSLSDEEPRSLGCKPVVKNLKKNRDECETEFDIWQKCDAGKGDLIEIKRHLYYSHWAVSVGDKEIIHLCDGGDGKAVVARDSLEDVAKNSLCRVNNLVAAAQRRGLQPRRVNDILKSVHKYLDEKVDYDPIKSNCEHFATYCRFGSGDYIPGQSGFSEQALAAKGKGIVKNGARLLTNSLMGTESISCCSRSSPKPRD